jgi:hypothetical protein
MNAEAQERYEREKSEKVDRMYTELDEMLYQWENHEIGDVSHFMQEWAERLVG